MRMVSGAVVGGRSLAAAGATVGDMHPPLNPRRGLTLTGVALVASLVGAGAAAATTEPVPPDESAAVPSDASDPSATPNPSEAPAASEDAGAFDIPGGVRPDVLEEGTWFDESGRLWSPEASTVSDEKQAAFCDFLFGTPDEIAEVFGVDGLRLVDGSGFVVLGGGGTGYRCGYVPDDAGTAAEETPTSDDTAGDSAATDTATEPATESSAADTAPESSAEADDEQPVIYFTLWDKAVEVEDDAAGVLEVFVLDVGDADETVLLALSDEFDWEMIDAEFAQAWLAAARDRLA